MASYQETLKGKYPGKLHAKRVAEYIRSKIPEATAGVFYLEGGKTRMIEDCDQEEHFRLAYHQLPKTKDKVKVLQYPVAHTTTTVNGASSSI